ncbi:hypothetical protein TNCV_1051121 [Trichonephila clavipes]|nr:hypothetical protein TNCV_1051121 [Trichonephila clavipes]
MPSRHGSTLNSCRLGRPVPLRSLNETRFPFLIGDRPPLSGSTRLEEHSDETHEQCTMVDVRAGVWSPLRRPHRTSDVVSGFQNVVDEAPQSMVTRH